MPAEKQFDVDVALTRAMTRFWAQGYEATSIQDLVAAMGINRGSLYATFGDKRRLFLEALRKYDHEYRDRGLSALAANNGPRAAILAAFEGAIEATAGGNRDGCLLVNTALELSPHDREVAAVVAEGLRETERFFRDMIEGGQAQGEIPAELGAEETARALLGLFVGLRVLSRSRPEPPLLRALADQASALLQ
jgi:TetR/AcrR family transcriptional repressor of nem operon